MRVFWTQVNSNWAQESSFEDHMVKSPLEALVVLRTNVRNRLLKFEFWKLALGYTHTFLIQVFKLKFLFLSFSHDLTNIHDSKFYKDIYHF